MALLSDVDVPGLELRGTALEEEGAGGDVVVIAPSSLATNAGGSAAGGRFFLLLDFLPLLDLFFTMISSPLLSSYQYSS